MKDKKICPHTNNPYDCVNCKGAEKKITSGRVHMCQSITGPLANWKKRDWEQATEYISGDGGKKLTTDELKRTFEAELRAGHEVVPISKCDNFCFKRGCLGHVIRGGDK